MRVAVERLPRWVRLAGTEVAAVGLPAVAASLGHPPFSWSLVATLVACALLPLRHVWPPLALLGGLWGLAGGLGWPPAIVSLYALGRWAGRMSRVWPWLLLPVVASVTPVLLTQDLAWSDVVLTIAFVALYAGAPAAMGLLVSTRARLIESLAELRRARASATAAAQDVARAQERARIGREIHDSVGHHATLIAVGAAALAAQTTDETARRSAEHLRGLAKRALAEMRAALGLLDNGTEPVQGLAEMAALVEGAQAAGVEVQVDTIAAGEPAEVPAAIGRAVYRVVQESLTNAVRHAPGAPVHIEVRRRPDELDVLVVNPAPPRATRRRREAFTTGGAGLTGLAERVLTAGGTLSAGPAAGGGFTVRATSPLAPTPDPLPLSTHESRLTGATNGGGGRPDLDGH
ncbi:sensor histidine kinase [Pseudonocardia lacus]|uniref:sensor histidine kinase n=1 Tax=Pseudonocardia lacus TaxID=2835865 RepID=UPI001BDD583F|nr:histidine kinase [Pseudonocardia lacus]